MAGDSSLSLALSLALTANKRPEAQLLWDTMDMESHFLCIVLTNKGGALAFHRVFQGAVGLLLTALVSLLLGAAALNEQIMALEYIELGLDKFGLF